MTYGEMRALLVLQGAGIDLDLIDAWIYDRYQRILDRLKWQRLDAVLIVQTVAPYETGTVEVTNGSNAITGAGTTWTAAMTGRMIRFGSSTAWYEFTYTSGTTGTLDRTYEGDTDAAATYKISKRVYDLPAECRIVNEVQCLDPESILQRESIKAVDPSRRTHGTPRLWQLYMESQTTPPATQIEVWPVPDGTLALQVSYTYDPTPPSATSASLLPWVRPVAIRTGVLADIAMHQEKFAAADRYERNFEMLVAEMVVNECRRRGGDALKAAAWMTRHRAQRWTR